MSRRLNQTASFHVYFSIINCELTSESVFKCFFSPVTSADCRISAYFVSWRRIVLHYVNFSLEFSCRPTAWLPNFVHWRPNFLAWNSWRLENLGLSRTWRFSFLTLVALQRAADDASPWWRRLYDVTVRHNPAVA